MQKTRKRGTLDTAERHQQIILSLELLSPHPSSFEDFFSIEKNYVGVLNCK